jgi:hypothetical protein
VCTPPKDSIPTSTPPSQRELSGEDGLRGGRQDRLTYVGRRPRLATNLSGVGRIVRAGNCATVCAQRGSQRWFEWNRQQNWERSWGLDRLASRVRARSLAQGPIGAQACRRNASTMRGGRDAMAVLGDFDVLIEDLVATERDNRGCARMARESRVEISSCSAFTCSSRTAYRPVRAGRRSHQHRWLAIEAPDVHHANLAIKSSLMETDLSGGLATAGHITVLHLHGRRFAQGESSEEPRIQLGDISGPGVLAHAPVRCEWPRPAGHPPGWGERDASSAILHLAR